MNMSCSQENCDRGLSLHGQSEILDNHEVQSEGNHGAETIQRESLTSWEVPLFAPTQEEQEPRAERSFSAALENNQRFCLHALTLLSSIPPREGSAVFPSVEGERRGLEPGTYLHLA